MAPRVTLTRASPDPVIDGFGTSVTWTSRSPPYTAAFMAAILRAHLFLRGAAEGGRGRDHRRVERDRRGDGDEDCAPRIATRPGRATPGSPARHYAERPGAGLARSEHQLTAGRPYARRLAIRRSRHPRPP